MSEPPSRKKVFSVVELTRGIKFLLQDTFGELWVEGEVSGLKQAASGHLYFDLKDADAKLPCALFKSQALRIPLKLRDGIRVRLNDHLDVFEPRGAYQLIVRQLEEAGKGVLMEAFEALKAKLREEGLFDEARKRRLPLMPACIGIVTSPSGAALHDILQVIERRHPKVRIVISPTRVQGEGSSNEIAGAIRALDAWGGCDVMIVGRGGGSIEDLWAFNEEPVARAIAAASVPVISAVGHEVDYTIADFVADVRAPTPSAAAEIVIGTRTSFEDRLTGLGRQLSGILQERALELRNRLDRAGKSYVFREPGHLVNLARERISAAGKTMRSRLSASTVERRSHLSDLQRDLLQHTEAFYRNSRQRVDEASMPMQYMAKATLVSAKQAVLLAGSRLKSLNPTHVLERGYSITTNERGRVIRSPGETKPGDILRTRVQDGEIRSKVEPRPTTEN